MTAPHTDRLTHFAAARDRAYTTIRRTILRLGDQRPLIGQPDLTYQRSDHDSWVEGFWPGQLWLAYADTGDETFADAARLHFPYFLGLLDRPAEHDHDLGFLYSLSTVAEYKLTGSAAARAASLRAADALAGRFNPRGQFIRAWNPWYDDATGALVISNEGRIIIDCVTTLPAKAGSFSGYARPNGPR